MWKHGIQELTSEYKRRHREALAGADSSEGEGSVSEEVGTTAEEGRLDESARSRSWLARVFGR